MERQGKPAPVGRLREHGPPPPHFQPTGGAGAGATAALGKGSPRAETPLARAGEKRPKKLRLFSENGNGEARQIAARMTQTNSAYVQAVKAIQQHAPELLDTIRSGTLRVPDAARLARLP